MTDQENRADYFCAAGAVQAARLERKRLEADLAQRLAPHKRMQEQISAPYQAKIAALLDEEGDALALWQALHQDLIVSRRAALLRGEHSPALDLPAGVSTRDDRVVEVTNVELIPLEFMAPKLREIRAHERHVPGTSVAIRSTLVCKGV